MKKQIISLGLSIFFVLSLIAVQAQNPQRGKDFSFQGKGKKEMMCQKVLTEEQQEAFKEIRLASMKDAKPLQDEIRELRAHHQTLMTAEKPNLNEIYTSIDKMSELKSELAKIRAKARVEMSSQLSEEQKLKMAQMKKMRKGKGHWVGHRQKHRGWND